MGLFKRFINASVKIPQPLKQRGVTERDLIKRESQIGAELFGPIPPGHRREFFCLDPKTWIWHEEWADRNGRHSITTRYEVRSNGIIKIQDGAPYQFIEGQELRYLAEATKRYHQIVAQRVYGRAAA